MKVKKRRSSREELARHEAAHHEAGHAIMALWRGATFDGISIELGEPTEPTVYGIGLSLGRFEGLRTPSDWLAAQCALAGPVASGFFRFGLAVSDSRIATWFNRLPVFGPYGTDVLNVENELMTLGWLNPEMPARVYQKRMRLFEMQTIPTIRAAWPDIQAIAARLLEVGYLSRSDCEQIILDRAPCSE